MNPNPATTITHSTAQHLSMGLRSGDRRLSFDILGISEDDEVMPTTSADSLLRSKSDPTDSCPSRKKKKRRKNRRGNSVQDTFVVTENSIPETSEINGDVSYSCTVSTVTEVAMVPDVDSEGNCAVRKHLGELRQRNVGNAMNGVIEETVSEESGNNEKNETVKEEMAEDRSTGNEINSENQVELNGRKLEKHVELNGRKLEKQVELNGRKLETEESLDWKKLMAEDPNCKLILLTVSLGTL